MDLALLNNNKHVLELGSGLGCRALRVIACSRYSQPGQRKAKLLETQQIIFVRAMEPLI